MNTKQEMFERLSSTRLVQKSFELFSYFRRKTERNSRITDDPLPELPQSVHLAEENAVSPIEPDDPLPELPQSVHQAEENAVSPIEPEVRDIECVGPSPPSVPALTHELKNTTKHIKLLRQMIDPIPPDEFENAKSFVIHYLTLPHITKLSNCYQAGFLEVIRKLRHDPSLSSYLYEKLTILQYCFPQLIIEFINARNNQDAAKAFILDNTLIIENLTKFYDEAQKDSESYQQSLEAELRRAKSQPVELAQFMGKENRVVNSYYALEEASMKIMTTKRDICRVLNEVEEICSDIDL